MAKHGSRKNGRHKRRSSRGEGRLYKRTGGKDYPADSPVNAPYWLQYTIPNPTGKGRGKCIRVALKDTDGNPITDKGTAEGERKRIVAPYQTGNTVETLKAVQARLQDAEEQHAQAVEEANPPLRMNDAEEAYLSSPNRPDSGQLTLDGYLSQWGRFITWMGEHHSEIVFMRDVDRQHVRSYVADMAELSASSFNQHVNTLRRFWRVLHEEARTDGNPWKRVQHKTVARIERRHRVLSLDEATTIIEAAEGELKDMLATIALTGQRLQDMCKLRWSSVDLDAGVISLVPTKTRRRNGKTVFIPVLPQTRAILEARPRDAATVFPEMARVFDRDRGATLTKRIRKVVEKAGLNPHEEGTGFIESADEDGNTVKVHSGQRAIVRISAHSLRHTFTTIARAAGIPDAVVRSIVGHTTASMTEHYTAFDKAIVRELSSRFEALPAGQYQLEAANPEPHREPLPSWARELVESLSTKNVKTVKAELLKGGVA
jgi:integrase